VTAGEQSTAVAVAAGLQPFLHDRIITVSAPTIAISGHDGHAAGHLADGLFHDDRRVLSRLVVSVPGVELAPIHAELDKGGGARFVAVVRGVGEHSPDPAVTLARHRSVREGLLQERIVVHNAGGQSVRFVVEAEVGADLATVAEVKSGAGRDPVPAELSGDQVVWRSPELLVTASLSGGSAELCADGGLLSAEVALAGGESWEGRLRVAVDGLPALFPAASSSISALQEPAVASVDARLGALTGRAVSDLRSLLLADPESPGTSSDLFLAAGAPWFLTLFGRDSLWAASMLLPLSTDIAGGTLRTLARRQGRVVDDVTEEAPGKIIHEVRRDRRDTSGLPPRYYGSIDGTPLWVTLLHDSWRWGLDPAEVEELLDPAEAALRWMRDYGDADGDGLLEYIDASGRGLGNQGWRDSSDSIRWHNGQLAAPPIALAEVQAYAYRAACAGADLLDAFGRPGADEWRQWAQRLQAKFAATFWLEGELGPYPAVALDADKRPADSVTSSLGHLLGTGLLDAEQEQSVARYLASPELDCGLGLRTLSAHDVGFNPLGYHTGSVWPHDTAIAVAGLAGAGYLDEAWSLADGLLDAGVAFDFRLPELFAGDGRGAGKPAPYPAACRPQAWSAAAAVVLLQTILGLEADVPGGWLRATPLPGPVWPVAVEGLRVGGHPLAVRVDESGSAHVETTDRLRIVT